MGRKEIEWTEAEEVVSGPGGERRGENRKNSECAGCRRKKWGWGNGWKEW